MMRTTLIERVQDKLAERREAQRQAYLKKEIYETRDISRKIKPPLVFKQPPQKMLNLSFRWRNWMFILWLNPKHWGFHWSKDYQEILKSYQLLLIEVRRFDPTWYVMNEL